MIERCGWCYRIHEVGPEHCLGGPVLVCGGRDYAARERVFAVLDRLALRVEIDAIRHGACGLDADDPFDPCRLQGADRWAHEWALDRRIRVEPMPAAWRREGRAAGPRRNAMMLERRRPEVPSSAPCCVVAFPGGKGTAGMVALARERGLPVWVIK